MSCGCPVVTSKTSSLPEVAGNGAILIDPHNTNEIAESLYEIIIDKQKRRKIINLGFKNIQRFSWEKTAKETLRVYEKALS